MNEQFAVATQDLEPRIKDLKDQCANLAEQGVGWKSVACLASVSASSSVCLELGSINYTVAERILWYVQGASDQCLFTSANFQPVLTLAEEILADMPLPFSVVDGAL